MVDVRRRAVIAAVLTAVLSGGLLAVAVVRGWLGPDVGRGATFCEAARDGLVKQPANTLSNLGFVVAGVLVAAHGGTKPIKAAMACLVVLLGPASAAMHATQSAAGGDLDVLSMYLIASFAFAYALMRWLRRGWATMALVFAAGVAGCEAAGLRPGAIPVVMSAGNVAFGVLLVAAAGLEIAIIRRGETLQTAGFAYASIGVMLLAFGIWNATQTWLCDPRSWLQGHAVWHLLTAVAAYLLYRYYDTERSRR